MLHLSQELVTASAFAFAKICVVVVLAFLHPFDFFFFDITSKPSFLKKESIYGSGISYVQPINLGRVTVLVKF